MTLRTPPHAEPDYEIEITVTLRPLAKCPAPELETDAEPVTDWTDAREAVGQ